MKNDSSVSSRVPIFPRLPDKMPPGQTQTAPSGYILRSLAILCNKCFLFEAYGGWIEMKGFVNGVMLSLPLWGMILCLLQLILHLTR